MTDSRKRTPVKTPNTYKTKKLPQFSSSSKSQTNHSRAGTQRSLNYTKKASSLKPVKQSSHIPSNSINVSTVNANDIEAQKSDMREILWQNPQLLTTDVEYRKKVWTHMAKTFHKRFQATIFDYDRYKDTPLPTKKSKFDENIHHISFTTNTTTNNTSTTVDENKNEYEVHVNNNDIITVEHLDILLNRYETYSDFVSKKCVNVHATNDVLDINHTIYYREQVIEDMRAILTAHAVANQNRFSIKGAVQLCAVILTTFSNGPSIERKSLRSDTFALLQILSQIMRDYYQNDEKLMKDETLLLIDLLCENEEKLVRKLSDLNIDAIDLCVFVSAWIGCLFANHFHIEFIQRVIDLVLLEGSSVLITIVYGIFQLIKSDILLCTSDIEVFDKLAGFSLKDYLKSHDFINNQVMTKAQLLFTPENYKYVLNRRCKKSWSDLLSLPGKKFFKLRRGIGDKNKVKKELHQWRRMSRKQFSDKLHYSSSEDSSFTDEDVINTGGGTNTSIGNNMHMIDRSSSTGNGRSSKHHHYGNGKPSKLMEYKMKVQQLTEELQVMRDTAAARIANHDSSDISSMSILHASTIIMHNRSTAEIIPEEEEEQEQQRNVHHRVYQKSGMGSQGSLKINTHHLMQNSGSERSSNELMSNMNSGEHSPYMPTTAVSMLVQQNSLKRNNHPSYKTLSDLLYINGDQIYLEQPNDNLQIRECQLRTENMDYSWKRALDKLDDCSISLCGYLCKMTSSRWNNRRQMDKVQRRWFVLRGNFLTYFKTDSHSSPKSDKCINISEYKCNPVQHQKSKYAFELISPPRAIRSKSQKGKKERLKFILLPDVSVDGGGSGSGSGKSFEIEQKKVRDKWVKSLRLAAKGGILWDILLNTTIIDDGSGGNRNLKGSFSGTYGVMGKSSDLSVRSSSPSITTDVKHIKHSSFNMRNIAAHGVNNMNNNSSYPMHSRSSPPNV